MRGPLVDVRRVCARWQEHTPGGMSKPNKDSTHLGNPKDTPNMKRTPTQPARSGSSVCGNTHQCTYTPNTAFRALDYHRGRMFRQIIVREDL